MTDFLVDAFTEAGTTALASHTPGTGGAWSKHPSYTAGASVIGGGGYARGDSTTSTAIYINAATPPSANYSVQATARITSVTNPFPGIIARCHPTDNTFYQLYLSSGTTWKIAKVVAGTTTDLAEWVGNPALNTDIALRLDLDGGNLRAYVDGVLRIAVTDAAITDPGRIGVRCRQAGQIWDLAAGDLVASVQDNPAAVTNGAWTWFTDPRAVSYNGYTYIGSIASNGDVKITRINNVTKAATSFILAAAMEVDDHDNPAIYIRPDGRIVAVYSKHNDASGFRVRISTNPEDISAWGAEAVISTGITKPCSYSNPFYLSGAGKLFNFFRSGPGGVGTNPIGMVESSDGGASWSAQTNFLVNTNQRPYVKWTSNGVDRIDFLITNCHPDEGASSVYHFYGLWDGSALKYYKSDGTLIGTSVTPADCTLIYDGTTTDAWVWDIAYGADGHPRVLFSKIVSATDHRYMYSRWTGSAWTTPVEVATAGTRLYAGEVNYSGGVSFDSRNADVIYASRYQEVAGWLLHEFRTSDNGASWSKYRNIADPIVAGQRNIRPYSPRNHTGELAVLWPSGSYTSYTSQSMDIDYASNDTYVDPSVDLEGTAAGAATATGAITTAIPFAGAAATLATGTGTITTGIDFAGAAASVSVAAAVATTAIRLDSAALAEAAAAAAFASSGATLGGAGEASASGAGALTTGIPFDGNAAALAAAVGPLTVEIRFSGAALAQALGAAGLTTSSGGLEGAAAGVAAGAAAITTGIPVIGEATATAGATGELGLPILLSGAAASVSAATGDLVIALTLEGYSLAQALGAGVLSAQIRLDAGALAQAAAFGMLAGTARETPVTRIHRLPALNRIHKVRA